MRIKKKAIFIAVGIPVVVIGLLVWFREPLLVSVGRWLEVQSPLQEADLVVALGGDRVRQDVAVRLLREGVARWVLFVGSDVRQQDYHCLDVPAERTVLPPVPADTTLEEAMVTRTVVQERGLRSILIVTSPYHLRRALLIFERVFAGTGVVLYFSSAPSRFYSTDSWWKTHVGRKAVLWEYLALLYYWLEA